MSQFLPTADRELELIPRPTSQQSNQLLHWRPSQLTVAQTESECMQVQITTRSSLDSYFAGTGPQINVHDLSYSLPSECPYPAG